MPESNTWKINPWNSWLRLEAAWREQPTERRATLVKAVRDHMEEEIRGHLEPLMDTLTAEPIYHFWGSGDNNMVIEGREAVRAFYSNMFATGGNQFEVVVENLIVGDDHVVTEGAVKQVRTGAVARAFGLEAIDGQPLADDELVLTTARLVTLWPGDPEGKLVGEDIYFGESPLSGATRITRDDLPDYYSI